VVVIDRRDISALGFVSKVDIPAFAAMRARVDGNLLYVTDQAGQWSVVDLSDPANPQIVSVAQTDGLTRNIAIAGTEAVVANGTSTIGFWNAADPTLPLLRGDHEIGWSVWDARYHAGVLHVAADLALGTVAGIPSPPALAEGLISLAFDSAAGTVSITGAPFAAVGSSTLTISAAVPSGGSASAAPDATGTFVLSFPAAVGEAITLTATDAEGRSTTLQMIVPGSG
jgi:hypothetical protein